MITLEHFSRAYSKAPTFEVIRVLDTTAEIARLRDTGKPVTTVDIARAALDNNANVRALVVGLGIDPDKMRLSLDSVIVHKPINEGDWEQIDGVPFTARAKGAVRNGIQIARRARAGVAFFNTSHLMLGLLVNQEQNPILNQFASYGVDRDKLQRVFRVASRLSTEKPAY